MSQAQFPALVGVTWNVVKRPQWNTRVQQSVSGRELRASYMSAPLWKWTLSYDILRQAAAYQELQQLVGFYNARQGRFDSFLYSDPTDNSVTAQAFGTGDGATSAFQLVRDYGAGGFTGRENVVDLNGSPSIYYSGSLLTLNTNYALSSTGLVTIVIAPPGTPSGTPSGTGGTLAAATYYAKVSVLNAAGESIGSAESSGVTTSGTTSSIAWSWPAVTGVTGVTGYRLMVGTAPGAETTSVTLGVVTSYTQTAALAAGPGPLATPTAALALPNGIALTWTGAYFWRVRFADDAQDFTNFMSQLWEAKSVSFVTAK